MYPSATWLLNPKPRQSLKPSNCQRQPSGRLLYRGLSQLRTACHGAGTRQMTSKPASPANATHAAGSSPGIGANARHRMPSRGSATCRDKRVDWQESACPSVLLQLHTPQRGSCACSSCSCNSHKHQRRHILLLRDPGIPAHCLPELEAATNDSMGLSKLRAQPLTLVSSGMRGTASPVKAPSKTSACLPRQSRTAWPSCLRAAPMAPSECAIRAAQTQ